MQNIEQRVTLILFILIMGLLVIIGVGSYFRWVQNDNAEHSKTGSPKRETEKIEEKKKVPPSIDKAINQLPTQKATINQTKELGAASNNIEQPLVSKLLSELEGGKFNPDNYADAIDLVYTSVRQITPDVKRQFLQQIILLDDDIARRTDVEAVDFEGLVVIISEVGMNWTPTPAALYLMTPDGYACEFGGLGALIEGCEHSKLKLLESSTGSIVTLAEDDFINAGTEETADIWPYSLGNIWYFAKEEIIIILGSGKYHGQYILYDLKTGQKIDSDVQADLFLEI